VTAVVYAGPKGRAAEAQRAKSGGGFFWGQPAPSPPARRSGEGCKLSPVRSGAEPWPPSGFAYI